MEFLSELSKPNESFYHSFLSDLNQKCNGTLRKKLDTVTVPQFILHGAAYIKNVEVEQNCLSPVSG